MVSLSSTTKKKMLMFLDFVCMQPEGWASECVPIRQWPVEVRVASTRESISGLDLVLMRLSNFPLITDSITTLVKYLAVYFCRK